MGWRGRVAGTAGNKTRVVKFGVLRYYPGTWIFPPSAGSDPHHDHQHHLGLPSGSSPPGPMRKSCTEQPNQKLQLRSFRKVARLPSSAVRVAAWSWAVLRGLSPKLSPLTHTTFSHSAFSDLKAVTKRIPGLGTRSTERLSRVHAMLFDQHLPSSSASQAQPAPRNHVHPWLRLSEHPYWPPCHLV